jgi:hypothetical protein
MVANHCAATSHAKCHRVSAEEKEISFMSQLCLDDIVIRTAVKECQDLLSGDAQRLHYVHRGLRRSRHYSV